MRRVASTVLVALLAQAALVGTSLAVGQTELSALQHELTQPAAMPTPASAGVPESALSAPADAPRAPSRTMSIVAGDAVEAPSPVRTPDLARGEWFSSYAHWFVNSDDTQTGEFFLAPRYTKRAGSWFPVDPGILALPQPSTPTELPALALAAEQAFRPVRFGASESRLLEIGLDGGPVTLSAPWLIAGTPQLLGGRVHYADVATDTDLDYRVGYKGVKEEIILRSPASPTSYNFHLADPTHQLGELQAREDGGYQFSTVIDGGWRLGFLPAYAYEAGHESESTPADIQKNSASLLVVPSGDGYDITVSVNPTWLAGKRYPIALDPSLGPIAAAAITDGIAYRTGTGDTTRVMDSLNVNEMTGSYNDGATAYVPVRSYMKFSTTQIKPNSQILSAYLQMHQSGCIGKTGAQFYCDDRSYAMDLVRLKQPWTTGYTYGQLSSASMTDNVRNSTLSMCPCQPADRNFYTWDFTSLMQEWSTNWPNEGFDVRAAGDATGGSTMGGPMFESANTSGGHPPQITVTWNQIPDEPRNVTAVQEADQAHHVKVSWSAPVTDGGRPITEYRVFPYDAATGVRVTPPDTGQTVCGTCGLSALVDMNMTPGRTYWFTVRAVNSVGVSAESVRSGTVAIPTVPAAPAAPSASATGTTTASVAWSAPADGGKPITSYAVSAYTAQTNALYSTTNTTGATNTTVTGLQAGTSYYFKVAAGNMVGLGPQSAQSSTITTHNVPGTPAPTATCGYRAATVTWPVPSSDPAIQYYNVDTYTGGGAFVRSASTTTNSYSATDLADGASYYFRVSATNAVGSGGTGQSNTITTCNAPQAPAVTAAPATGAGQALVTWAAATDNGSAVLDYRVSAYTPAGTRVAGPFTVSAATRSYTVSGLTMNASYYFGVSARNGVGTGGEGYSAVIKLFGPPAAPSVSATPLADPGQARVDWAAPEANGSTITGYTVRAYTAGGALASGPSSAGTATTFTVTGLTPGGQYYFTVTATNGYGTGAVGTSATITLADRPGAPSPTAVPGDRQVVVSWTAPADNGSPILDYTVTTFNNASNAQVGAPVVIAATTATNYDVTVTALTNGTAYRFDVSARNRVGTATGTTGPATPFGKPIGPTAVTAESGALSGTANVSWDAANPNGTAVTDYTVQAYAHPSGAAVAGTSRSCASCTSLVYIGLVPGAQYTFDVTATNQAGSTTSPRSNVVTLRDAPLIVKTVVGAAPGETPSFDSGETVVYTLDVTDQQGLGMSEITIADALPAGLIPSETVIVSSLVDGAWVDSTCPANPLPGEMRCTVAAGALSVSHLSLAPNATKKIRLTAVVSTTSRACEVLTNSATATNAYSARTSSVDINACGSGLGVEPWWSYSARPIGPQSQAMVNVANGNLVVQATDTTPVQAHGRLSYVLRRSYNSQLRTIAALPGAIGAGWQFNIAQGDELNGAGVTTSGLTVPATESVLSPLAVTMIDRDGTKHVFRPAGLAARIPVLSTLGALPATAALPPRALSLSGSGYTNVCVDTRYNAPPGVHLGLWRYLAVQGSAPTDCVGNSGTFPVVLGYAAERTDRVRYEWSADGQALSMVDGAGVELRYVYGAPPVPTSSPTIPPTAASMALGRLGAVFEPRSCTTTNAPGTAVRREHVPTRCRALRFAYDSDGNGAEDSGGTLPSEPQTAFSGPQITVTDPAGRTTRYFLDAPTAPAPAHLLHVVNPDATTVSYTYGGCGGSADQLCSASDPNGALTRFAYVGGPNAASPSVLSSLTDRRGTAVRFDYTDGTATRVTDGSQKLQLYKQIDERGRVGELDEGDAATGLFSRVSYFTWDSVTPGGASTTCRRPTAAVDNNLCLVQRLALNNGATPDVESSFTYNDSGQTLSEHRCLATTTNSAPPAGQPLGWQQHVPTCPGAPSADAVDTTFGYHNQYFQADGTVLTDDQTASGSGAVIVPARTDASTLYVVTDNTQRLTGRGNAVPAAQSGRYLTTLVVDYPPSPSPDDPNAAQSVSCASGGLTTGNSGLLCAKREPSSDVTAPNTPTQTHYRYDTFGQRVEMTTPKAVVEGKAPYRYDYYSDAECDLSGYVSSGGWLKASSDPTGNFAAFGYDRAGNPVRSWDRSATAGLGVAAFPGASPSCGEGNAATPTTQRYAQRLYGAGSTALTLPWRYLRSQRDALGNTSRFTLDANGNATTVRPPRGDAAGTDRFDVRQLFSADDLLRERLLPAESAAQASDGVDHPERYDYDAYGRRVATVEADGGYVVQTYDAVDRAVRTFTTRGTDTSTTQGCQVATAATAPPVPAGRVTCSRTTAYDGVDNVTAQQDAAGQTTTHGYDGMRRRVRTDTPRNDGTLTTLSAETVYDADGNVVLACSPRQRSEGGAGSCTLAGPAYYSQHTVYDFAGRPFCGFTYRDTTATPPAAGTCPAAGSGSPQTTRRAYDADGNVTSVTDPNGHVTQVSYDVLDRRTAMTVPRSATEANTTKWAYDPSGDVVAVARPGVAGDNLVPGADGTAFRVTGYTYDAAHRNLDTVEGLQVASADPAADPVAISAALATATTDADGGTNIRTRLAYDEDNRVVTRYTPRAFTAPRGSPSAPDVRFSVRTSFDTDGRPVSQYAPRYDTTSAAETPPATEAVANADQAAQCATTENAAAGYVAGGASAYIGLCVTKVSYDFDGNAVRVQLPTYTSAKTNRFTSYNYTEDNLLVSVDAPSPKLDGARITAQRYVRDGEGRVTQDINGLAHATATAYNSDGTAREVRGPDGPGGLVHTTRYGYDANGAPTRVEKPRTVNGTPETDVTATSYFPDGKVAAVRAPGVALLGTPGYGDESVTSYTYDRTGNVASVTSPSANAGDANNTARTPTTYTYTDDDLLSTTTVPVATDGSRSRVERFGYDRAGRRASARSDYVGTGATTGSAQTFGYYPNDRPARQTGRDGVTAVVTRYDAAGNRVSIAGTSADGTTDTVTADYYLDDLARTVSAQGRATRYAYDGNGHVTARAAVAGTTTTSTYGHNDAGLLATAASPITNTARWTYNELGAPAVHEAGNGQWSAYTYNSDSDDTLARLTVQVKRTPPGGAERSELLASHDYTYDESYRIRSQRFTGEASGAPGASVGPVTFGYEYDPAGHVSRFTRKTDVATLEDAAVRWDHDGNRLAYGNRGADYNADDSIARTFGAAGADPRAYSYDEVGRLRADGCATQAYDGLDRLSSVTPLATTPPRPLCPAGSASYRYDGLDRQTARSETRGGATSTLGLHYDGLGGAGLAQTGGAGGEVSYALDDSGRALAAKQGSTTHFLAEDGTGSVATVTDAAGDVACTARYTPWGEPASNVTGSLSAPCNTGDTFANRFYRADRRDEATGFYQLGARSYDPANATFLTPDGYRDDRTGNANLSVGTDPLTRNGYGFVNGDPVNFVDPSGHMATRVDEMAKGCDAECHRIVRRRNAIFDERDRWHRQNKHHWYSGLRSRDTALVMGRGFTEFSVGLVNTGLDLGNLALAAHGVHVNLQIDPIFDDPMYRYSRWSGTVTGLVIQAVVLRRVTLGGTAVKARVAPASAARAGAAETSAGRSFQSYTKVNSQTGEVYAGRASGYGTPLENIARRDAGHAYNDLGFGPARLDQSGSYAAIRGREQQLIERFRDLGVSANKINGISPRNPNLDWYLERALRAFGAAR